VTQFVTLSMTVFEAAIWVRYERVGSQLQ